MPQTQKYQATPWKLALAFLVGAFLAGMATTITIAANRVTPVTDADYYNNGLHYGRTASGSRNPGLGWSLTASLAEGDLQVRVTDESGAPISGGKLTFEPKAGGTAAGGTGTGAGAAAGTTAAAAAGVGSGAATGVGTGTGLGTLALREAAPGVYRTPRPAARQGDLHGTLRFTKGEAAASRKLVLFN